jgi:hypothetical protein
MIPNTPLSVMQPKTNFEIAKSCPIVLQVHTKNFIQKYKLLTEILQFQETSKTEKSQIDFSNLNIF